MPEDYSKQPRNLPLAISAEKCSGAVGAAKVILGCRNVLAGEEAKDRIIKDTGKTGTAEVWALDLASYDSVKDFAKKAIAELDRIDALIENAAVASGTGKAEGHGLCMTVNVYSTFLLGVLLLPKLKECAQQHGITPHLTIVTSNASFQVEQKWNEIKDDPLAKMEDDSLGMVSYPLSKLMVTFAARELADLLPVSQTGVVVNSVNPGVCKTDLSRNAPAEFRRQLAEMHEKFGRTAEDGSRTLLHGAVGGKESHGRYLSDCEIADDRLPSWVTDEDAKKAQRLVWGGLAKELEVISPGCVKAIL
ncbi:hypothetical protein EYB25_005156 [Talaromyces marneffei]|uniref:uncharacterized protein n=1 Tax=Talaromyces marneffei TaxID=37727 RepID=UPI0012A8783A|nr:uncharacterized protein EYB26_003794 [Talaromyces marneffei]KAE8553774.1 hypothetical protein EYB25_005156 [Talaromyces marneffei]QGA16127.1 hypothetical protein EYB26_003794 [Talaromyces marneffei]